MTFQTDIECARKRINKWVSEQTNGKIQQLLSPGSLKEDTRVVVLATTYFKGESICLTYTTYKCL